MAPMTSQRPSLFGMYIDPLTMTELVERCRQALATRQRMRIGVLNAAKVVALREDLLLRESLLECDVTVADGQSVVWASRLLRRPLPERVTGVDLFEHLLDVAHADHLRIYLLGATREVLAVLQERLLERFPGMVIAGTRDGYFSDTEASDVADDILASGADMLFLGISSPKKEIFLKRYGPMLGVPIQHGVGGAFDIFAGVTKRAPNAWQRVGMEWAYRLWQEPSRMWRRYLVGNTAFLARIPIEAVRPTPPYPRPLPVDRTIDVRDPRPRSVPATVGALQPAAISAHADQDA